MKISGKYTFEASQQEVWDVLTDPDAFAQVMPGVEKFEPVGEDEWASTLNVGLAAVKGTYEGKVSMKDKNPPSSYKLHIEGKGTPGFVNGEGTLELAENPDGTTQLSYHGEAQIGGTIASVGQRLLDSAAKSMIRQAFDGFAQEIQARKIHKQVQEAAQAHAAQAMAAPENQMASSQVEGQSAQAEKQSSAATYQNPIAPPPHIPTLEEIRAQVKGPPVWQYALAGAGVALGLVLFFLLLRRLLRR
ncbi:MAG: carbon monoxide dehydrogenase subunit G [Chloroflexi bacterium]|nr:carbon monoxide dehydrogenase subunit G [Chloroflexota bacterium]